MATAPSYATARVTASSPRLPGLPDCPASADLPPARARILAIWLFANAAMVFAMAVIGAITRLTESGLSITVWEPLTGWRWPADAAAWQAAFDLYRETPQYRAIFAGMSLAEFKEIFFWEWFHRLWGRLIGVVYAVPFLVFLALRWVPKALLLHLFGLLLLGGLQGWVGWFMVESGLESQPSVSHYRLALHLGLALIIYALLIALALHLLRPGTAKRHAPAPLLWPVAGMIALLAVTIIWGAFVAGLDAGMIYNTFPLMDGQLIPGEAWALDPAWRNPIDNHATVQFLHRMLGMGSGIAALALAAAVWSRIDTRPARGAALALSLAVSLQIGLGITTILTQVWLPVAALHQAGAILLLGVLIWLRHEVVGRSGRLQPVSLADATA